MLSLAGGLESLSAELRRQQDGQAAALKQAAEQQALALQDQLATAARSSFANGAPQLSAGLTVAVEPDGDGLSFRVGSDCPYLGALEDGFQGSVQVREHLRKMTVAFGLVVTHPRDILVRSAVRQMNIPAHSFLQPVLESALPDIGAALSSSLSGEGAA